MIEEIKSIEAQIAEADAKKAALAAELEKRKAAMRSEFLIDTVTRAKELGLSDDDLIEALGGKRKDAVKVRKPRQARALISDPSKVYLGGALPVWMRDEMKRSGMDWTDKGNREAFIANRMQAE